MVSASAKKAPAKRSFARAVRDCAVPSCTRSTCGPAASRACATAPCACTPATCAPGSAGARPGVTLVGQILDQARRGVPALSAGPQAVRAHDPQPGDRHQGRPQVCLTNRATSPASAFTTGKSPRWRAPASTCRTSPRSGVILAAIPEHWSVAENPHSRFRNAAARTFFSRRDQAIVGVQVSTGLRISETFGLRLQDYSAEQRTPDGHPVQVRPAARRSRRRRRWPGFWRTGCACARRPARRDFLFVSEFGTQLHRDSWGHQFQRYLEFARSQGHALPRITLHSLRHLAGTAMAEHDLYHASLMLGHSSIKVTADNYLHARAEKSGHPRGRGPAGAHRLARAQGAGEAQQACLARRRVHIFRVSGTKAPLASGFSPPRGVVLEAAEGRTPARAEQEDDSDDGTALTGAILLASVSHPVDELERTLEFCVTLHPIYSSVYAHELTKREASDSIGKIGSSLLGATVDLNPHQIDAALFAFRSPLSRGHPRGRGDMYDRKKMWRLWRLEASAVQDASGFGRSIRPSVYLKSTDFSHALRSSITPSVTACLICGHIDWWASPLELEKILDFDQEVPSEPIVVGIGTAG